MSISFPVFYINVQKSLGTSHHRNRKIVISFSIPTTYYKPHPCGRRNGKFLTSNPPQKIRSTHSPGHALKEKGTTFCSWSTPSVDTSAPSSPQSERKKTKNGPGREGLGGKKRLVGILHHPNLLHKGLTPLASLGQGQLMKSCVGDHTIWPSDWPSGPRIGCSW